jgi:hypothetical protein
MVLLYHLYFMFLHRSSHTECATNNYPVVVIYHTFWAIKHGEIDLQGELQEPRDRALSVQHLFDRKTALELGVLPPSKELWDFTSYIWLI